MILASDYDGTLCRGRITEEDRAAIVRFREAGHLFGVVTGRDFPMAFEPLTGENGAPFDFIICLNGALAVDSKGDILFEKSADGAVIPHLFRTVLEAGAGHLGIVNGKTRRDFTSEDLCDEGYFTSFLGKYGITAKKHGDGVPMEQISRFTHANTWFSSEEEAARAVELIRDRHGDFVNPLQNGVCVDIPPAGVDKGTGIADYAALMGVPHDQIRTAGDNYNDLAMLTRFHGCAMENGVPAAKAAAKEIYPDIASIVRAMLLSE